MARSLNFREHVPLAPFTTFQVGGPARWFVEVSAEDEVVEAVRFARARDLPLLVLGGGSNVLVADCGFRGLIIHMAISGLSERPAENGRGIFSVAAGEDWDAFVSLAVSRNYGGVECLAGIPGTAGGTPIQNVGAYGQEVSQTITLVRALDLASMCYVDLPASACGFGYRSSIFNTTERDRYIVTQIELVLTSSAIASVNYPDLKTYLHGAGARQTLTEVAAAVKSIRRSKGMLLVPSDPDCRSAGSFFKNPIVPSDQVSSLAVAAGVAMQKVPAFAFSPDDEHSGRVKIPAAWLLERTGFYKGYRLGTAGISHRHTLALVNLGMSEGQSEGKAQAILDLRDQIVEKVEGRFGIRLLMEPRLVGFDGDSSLT